MGARRMESSLAASGLVLPSRTRIPRGILLPPTVGGAPEGLILPGDRIRLDGSSGLLTLEGVREIPVVTSFLLRPDGRLLLGRRSHQVGSFAGRWAGISGHVETDPRSQAFQEIQEETGLSAGEVHLERVGAPLFARAGPVAYRIHPFLFRVGHPTLRRDWEHTEFRWVRPEALD
ncbi:MAG: NUDIX domain-containing protein, partial [Thermoplasmata archaeon]